MYQISGEMKRRYTIYVEDEFASAIVRRVALDMKMLRHIYIFQFGSIENTVNCKKKCNPFDFNSV